MTPEEYQFSPVVNKMNALQPASLGAEARSGDPSQLIAPNTSPIVPTMVMQNSRILASPKARRLAQETHQDLSALHGSGPGGAVLARDVESSIATSWQPMLEPASHSQVAAHQFNLQRNVQAAQFLAWHALLKQTSVPEITITDLLVFIVSRALATHPKINGILQDEKINILNDIHISLALALEDGMVVPVIRHADHLSPGEIAKERQELVTRARAGKLRNEDSSGGTFTICNVGMYGVDSFNPVLNSSQAAILAVGRITEQVIPINGSPVIQPVINLNVSFNPRSVDVANGAKFLETLVEIIEEPLMLLT